MVSKGYICGFIDGEGSFMIYFRSDTRYSSGYHVEPRLNITQKNKAILESIKETLGAGRIYFHKRDQLWHLNIERLKDLLRITKYVKESLFVKKNQASKFYQCLLLMSKKKHKTSHDVNKMFILWNAPNTEVNTRYRKQTGMSFS